MLRRAASGLPGITRVYRTSRWYVPVHRALGVVAASGFLYVYVAWLGGVRRLSDNEVNAARHFAWQVYLSARLGYAGATTLGDAHETGSVAPADSARDSANNGMARDWYRVHEEQVREETGRLIGPVDLARLVTRGLGLYREGRMFARGTAERARKGFHG